MGDNEVTALLFSGGVDSTAVAAWRRPDFLLTIDYGQITAQAELKSSKLLANKLGITHSIIRTDMGAIGSGSLANVEASSLSEHNDWWPFRNQLLITIGAAWAIRHHVNKILIGTVNSDNCFSDGCETFFQSLNNLLHLQEGRISVEAPAIKMNTVDLIKQSGFDTKLLPLCFSCNQSTHPCGTCRGCKKHQEATYNLGFDPY